jgi:hypothetical protein
MLVHVCVRERERERKGRGKNLKGMKEKINESIRKIKYGLVESSRV